MKFVAFFSLLLFTLLASACAAPTVPPTTTPTSRHVVQATSAPPTPAATRAPSSTPTLRPTRTPAPTDTPTPLPTDTPPPTLTPTLGPPITRTPAPAAQCPKSSGQTPKITLSDTMDGFDAQILDYLNARGSAEGLKQALGVLTIPVGSSPSKINSNIIVSDVTGDLTPDVVMDLIVLPAGDDAFLPYGAVFVYACSEGRFLSSFKADLSYIGVGASLAYDGIRAVSDMNLNGVPEIIFSFVDNCGTHLNCTRPFRIVEWDGMEFKDLIHGRHLYTGEIYTSAYVYNGDGVIRDTNGDGYLELTLTNGIEHYYPDSGPDRERTEIWAWNGSAFTLVRWEHTPPVYRIHAVWDGDDASRFGAYTRALAFYQQAIFDEKLLGWSAGQYWRPASETWFWQDYTPPPPDPDERSRLSAYARYRILLLHTVQGNLLEAQVVYDTLQQKYPVGSIGDQYAALATVFWETYNTSPSLAAACNKAVAHADAHAKEILSPLGYDVYYQRSYTPEDICPFK